VKVQLVFQECCNPIRSKLPSAIFAGRGHSARCSSPPPELPSLSSLSLLWRTSTGWGLGR
jgi:hypothetical protein